MQATRSIRLAPALLACLFVASCSQQKQPADVVAGKGSATRPNIIIIFTDDHCTQATSAYGSIRNKTPNIDRLATEGMRFDNCFVTNGICAPSRAVTLTGKHCHKNGVFVNGLAFDQSQATFPKLLHGAGYQTAFIGKWHLINDPVGFDHWEVLIDQGPYYNPPMIRNGEKVQYTGYTTDIITDLALDWLKDQRTPDKPFLLMYQHKAPHRDWEPGPGYFHLYDDVTLPEPPTLFDDWSGRGPASQHQEMMIAKDLTEGDLHLTPPRRLKGEQLEEWNAAYDAKNEAFREANLTGDDLVRWKYQRYAKDYLRCVASVDDNVGRLLDYLDDTGLAKNTVVIYASDQGWFLGEHGWFDKRWMYEESLRIPFLVRWPGVIKPGSVNKDLVQNLDVAQTLLDAAGVAAPDEMQGRSIVPLLEGQTPDDWRHSIYYHFYANEAWHKVPRHYGVRTDRFKLIHFYQLGEWELYDMKEDPEEMLNLYGLPGYEDITNELKAEIKRLQKLYDVTDETDRQYDEFVEKRRKSRT